MYTARESPRKKGYHIMLAVILLTVLAATPSAPPLCVEIPTASYVSEWAQAKKLVGWDKKVAYPHHVIECSYIAYLIDLDRRYTQMYGTSAWKSMLDKKGRMIMEEYVTIYLPGNRKQRSITLVHEFIHILRGRLRHAKDPRGMGLTDEEFICNVFPEGCNK